MSAFQGLAVCSMSLSCDVLTDARKCVDSADRCQACGVLITLQNYSALLKAREQRQALVT